MYGSNGQLRKTEGLVIERFTDFIGGDNGMSRHTKVIVNPRKTNMVPLHWGIHPRPFYDIDTHGQPRRRHMLDYPPQHDVIRINHYFTKSYEEFQNKRKRGRADLSTTPNQRKESEFFIFPHRTGMTDNATAKYIPIVKANIQWRYRMTRSDGVWQCD
jgi:hypothetical protein